MMKKKLTLTAVLTVCLLISVVFAAVTYAWIFLGDTAQGMEYSIAKIDSSVILYRANDDNLNGIPNRLDEDTSAKYYIEQYSFEQLGEEKFALSEDSEANMLTDISLTDVFPTQNHTFKYALVNKSTAENLITFKLVGGEYDDVAFLSTLSFRLGIVRSDSVDSTATVEFGDEIYLADHINGSTLEDTEIKALDDAIFIDGMTGAETPDNYCDFWLQIEMESYEVLSGRDGFTLTEDEYNALQGKTVDIPNLYIYFEIVV